MKSLPKIIRREVFLKVDYIICRFKQSKEAYKITQRITKTFFTIKKVNGIDTHENQYHFHIRFHGKDKWKNKSDIIDIDLYIPTEELKKLEVLP